MKLFFVSFITQLIKTPRGVKRFIVVFVDAWLCVLATWLAMTLRVGEFVSFTVPLTSLTTLSLGLAILLLSAFGLYGILFRYSGSFIVIRLVFAFALYGLSFGAIVVVAGIEGIPRTVGILQPLILFVFVLAFRFLIRICLIGYRQTEKDEVCRHQVVIYGAGSAGRNVLRSMPAGMRVVGFLDDATDLHNQILDGFMIYPSDSLPRLIESDGVDFVLLAMPSLSRERRRQIIERISEFPLSVRTVPSLSDITNGLIDFTEIRELDIADLLGRESVAPDQMLLKQKVHRKIVLITGAGGSIGSELCRQILVLNPRVLLLVELSEFALYKLCDELTKLIERAESVYDVAIVPLLCSVQDTARVRDIISTWKPDTIYHAAAYKHVPMLEHNVIEAINNNVFGTLVVAEAADDANVSDFVLISTDKAVRPANVMGATKRLAEMVLQAVNAKNESEMRISIVRFGNVLESSGSVIPRFRAQIAAGGPITVTHPEVNRYFMTIPEAAQLVIQASALSKGGEIFVLDMGEPVKIIDLAKKMIHLSGLTERTSVNPSGDIEIQFSGLRAGEKLYEELLMENNPEQTLHSKIFKARESSIGWEKLSLELDLMKRAIDERDIEQGFMILRRVVAGFENNNSCVDWVYLKKACSLHEAN